MRAFATACLLACFLLPSCRSGCDSPEFDTLIASLSIAGSIGAARQTSEHMQADVNAAADISQSESADLIARAQILSAHADSLSAALDRFDETGQTNQSITLKNLQIRAAALDDECRLVTREWNVWQVKSGRKKPADVYEFVDVRELVEANDR